MQSVSDDGYGSQEVWVPVIGHLLGALCEERDGIFILCVTKAFQALAENHIVER